MAGAPTPGGGEEPTAPDDGSSTGSGTDADDGRRLPTTPRRMVLYVGLIVIAGIYLSPLQSGFVTAFKTVTGATTTAPYLPPSPADAVVSPWEEAFSRLQSGLINSILFAVPATLLSAFLGSMAAFGLTKIDWRGQLAVLLLFVAGVFIPYQSVLVPLRQFWGIVDLETTFLSFGVLFSVLPVVPGVFETIAAKAELIELTITHTAFGIPICTVLFRGYYFTIDDDIVEAAKIDGASTFRIYRRIILPLSKPMFAVALIYQFTNIWNDLLFALVLTGSGNRVATESLNLLQGSMLQEYNVQMAGAFLVALPTLIIYIVFGRQFARGVAGAN